MFPVRAGKLRSSPDLPPRLRRSVDTDFIYAFRCPWIAGMSVAIRAEVVVLCTTRVQSWPARRIGHAGRHLARATTAPRRYQWSGDGAHSLARMT